jgi:tetratricopeptide (TPR) repeat protein
VDEGLRWAGAFGDAFYVGQFRFARMLLAFEEGNVDEVERALGELLDEGEFGAHWGGSAGVRWLQAGVHRARGRLDEARRVLEEQPGRQNLGLISTAWSLALLAEIQQDQGDLKNAVETARAAVDHAGEEVLARAVSLRTLSAALLAFGKASEAEATVREELALLQEADWDVETIRALVALVRTLDAQRRVDESAEAMDRARALIATQPPGIDLSDLEASLLT